MQRDLPRSYDELLARRYGRPSRRGERGAQTLEDLLASYYGAPSSRRNTPKRIPPTAVAQTLSDDGGELLVQAVDPAARPAATEEYVVERSLDEPDLEEYVVRGMALSEASAAEVGAEAQPGRDVSVIQEFGVDLRPPLEPALPPPSAVPPGPRATSGPEHATEDDFIADMQSILTGQKVFDPGSKRLVERDKLVVQNTDERLQLENLQKEQAARAEPASTESADARLPAPDAKDAHDIFRRIAQSMELANAYDLGDFELEKRLSSFDQEADAATHDRARNRSTTPPRAPAGSTVGSVDFLHDLDAIHQERAAKSAPSETPLEAPAESSSTGG